MLLAQLAVRSGMFLGKFPPPPRLCFLIVNGDIVSTLLVRFPCSRTGERVWGACDLLREYSGDEKGEKWDGAGLSQDVVSAGV